jgi:hypothetical protein
MIDHRFALDIVMEFMESMVVYSEEFKLSDKELVLTDSAALMMIGNTLIGDHVLPFFFQIDGEHDEIKNSPDRAVEELAARNPVFYYETLFRAVLGYSEEKINRMSAREFTDSRIMVNFLFKWWHAPYINEKE